MNRRNFLLAIPLLAVASKVKLKPVVPFSHLPVGTSGQVLAIVGVIPRWIHGDTFVSNTNPIFTTVDTWE